MAGNGWVEQLKELMVRHVASHAGLYFFLFVLFAVGVAFGALATGAMEDHQKLELVYYLNYFMEGVSGEGAPQAPQVFRAALAGNLRTLALIVLLGLTVVGSPLVPVIVFLRGFILGFSIGFLMSHMGWSGMGVALLAILPQNLMLVPAFLVLAASSLLFTTALVRRRGGDGTLRAGIQLASSTLGALAMVVAASLIEGYVSPSFLRLLARWWG